MDTSEGFLIRLRILLMERFKTEGTKRDLVLPFLVPSSPYLYNIGYGVDLEINRLLIEMGYTPPNSENEGVSDTLISSILTDMGYECEVISETEMKVGYIKFLENENE